MRWKVNTGVKKGDGDKQLIGNSGGDSNGAASKRTDEAGKADRLTLKLWLRLLEGKGLSKHKWAVD